MKNGIVETLLPAALSLILVPSVPVFAEDSDPTNFVKNERERLMRLNGRASPSAPPDIRTDDRTDAPLARAQPAPRPDPAQDTRGRITPAPAPRSQPRARGPGEDASLLSALVRISGAGQDGNGEPTDSDRLLAALAQYDPPVTIGGDVGGEGWSGGFSRNPTYAIKLEGANSDPASRAIQASFLLHESDHLYWAVNGGGCNIFTSERAAHDVQMRFLVRYHSRHKEFNPPGGTWRWLRDRDAFYVELVRMYTEAKLIRPGEVTIDEMRSALSGRLALAKAGSYVGLGSPQIDANIRAMAQCRDQLQQDLVLSQEGERRQRDWAARPLNSALIEKVRKANQGQGWSCPFHPEGCGAHP